MHRPLYNVKKIMLDYLKAVLKVRTNFSAGFPIFMITTVLSLVVPFPFLSLSSSLPSLPASDHTALLLAVRSYGLWLVSWQRYSRGRDKVATSLAREDEMNAFAPSVMGSRDEAKRERRCGVCRPWVPGPPNISALSEARRHKGGRMWGMGICVFMGACVWKWGWGGGVGWGGINIYMSVYRLSFSPKAWYWMMSQNQGLLATRPLFITLNRFVNACVCVFYMHSALYSIIFYCVFFYLQYISTP